MQQMSNKSTPTGFTIRFDRHRRRWGWKQTFDVATAQAAGHTVERFTFARRPEALQDLTDELERRKAPPKRSSSGMHAIVPTSA